MSPGVPGGMGAEQFDRRITVSMPKSFQKPDTDIIVSPRCECVTKNLLISSKIEYSHRMNIEYSIVFHEFNDLLVSKIHKHLATQRTTASTIAIIF